jgi:hypothetical protein
LFIERELGMGVELIISAERRARTSVDEMSPTSIIDDGSELKRK